MPRLVVNLPDKLYAELEGILVERNLSFEEVVRLYCRSMVTTNARTMALQLGSEMPFGKFKGEPIDVVIRADPGYVGWMLANNERFILAPEALQLYEFVIAPKEPTVEKKTRGRPRKLKIVESEAA